MNEQKKNKYFMSFDIDDFLKYADDVKNISDINRAYAWYDCQKAFNNRNDLTDSEYRAKELFIYLANWGMVARGSFVMQHTWRIFKDVVEKISNKDYDCLRNVTSIEGKELNELIEKIDELYKKINKKINESLNHDERDISSSLITKILLGTTGCIIAYDQNVRNAISMFNHLENAPKLYGSAGYSIKAVKSIYQFYLDSKYKEKFDNKLSEINSDKTHPKWTIMKLIDYCMWNYWNEYGNAYIEWNGKKEEKNK